MEIINSKIEDIDTIFKLYDDAIAYQKKVFNKQWQGFERDMIEEEIQENRQFKIIINGEVACIFAITFNDAVIWQEKDNNSSIYIHRIVTNPEFRGAKFVNYIIEWAKIYCKTNGKEFIRMDTWGDNPRLISYYVNCGFEHIETIILEKSDGLPAHYNAASLALFEIKI